MKTEIEPQTEPTSPALEPFLVPLSGRAEAVRSVVEPHLAAQGFELVKLQFVQGDRRTLLRLFIDAAGYDPWAAQAQAPHGDAGAQADDGNAGAAPPKGITIDQLAHLNRTLGDLLDVEDADRGLFKGAWGARSVEPGRGSSADQAVPLCPPPSASK